MRQFPGVNKNALNTRLQTILHEQHIQINPDYLRDSLQLLVHELMEMDIRRQTAAARYERNQKRRVYRNGYRESSWHSIAGTLTLRIPKLRQGSYYPAFLHAEQHLQALTITACLVRLDADMVMSFFYCTGIMPCTYADAEHIAHSLNELADKYQQDDLKKSFQHTSFHDFICEIDSQGRIIRRRILLAIGETTAGQQLIVHDVIHEADATAYRDFVRTLSQRGTIDGLQTINADAYSSLNPNKRRIETPAFTHSKNILSYAA